MRLSLVFVVMIVVILAGCAPKIVYVDREVLVYKDKNIPVYVCPAEIHNMPDLSTGVNSQAAKLTLDDVSNPGKVVQSVIINLTEQKQRKEQALQQNKIMRESCKPPTNQ